MILFLQALMATALFRIWPTLLFMGGWATMVVCVSNYTTANLGVPSTLLTALGVVLGLTLNYRTSSAYERYTEGRRMWSQITLASRTWARIVWIHCPDTSTPTPSTDPDVRAKDQVRSEIEKATIVQMALAFAVSVKHYLRGEEGIYYEDLYDLVNFIPSLHLPSGLPSSQDANINIGRPPTSNYNTSTISTVRSSESKSPSDTPLEPINPSMTPHSANHNASYDRPYLMPAMNPPKFHLSSVWPFKYFRTRHQSSTHAARKLMRRQAQSADDNHNVPLEITLYMSTYIYALQRRKTTDVPTLNALIAALAQMTDALSTLERILTTPIPWSYNAHIWEVSWMYCLFLPFQLYEAGFGWVTIPAVMLTSYVIIGILDIGGEIENPFGYDKNDLNLDFFTEEIIRRELAAVISRPVPLAEEWMFSPHNRVIGGVSVQELERGGIQEVRRRLRGMCEGVDGRV
ncbi:hypothetical protein TREMEDRAFT_24583 [Tremella mesenterica DSM 1558]|uniref:uncharacterized protein n=1 Tax=Tremella mesenterica (strain ATCC 24925 / CBS 8224 / DSM 1558 / NBRC 9311 / NRRL Y-6157 / RJB 2259-6 / UBC 559-6) TaxID=578456 RepID=UPI0003F48E27|nr:uncharacterized protein TREMEDRAFT_24583 [Tremella mesenterica DSM 1558]EIW72158.1 hypothetical protein TREMEDRAFT_24583 [Tremella mesenterica DSM 1558]